MPGPTLRSIRSKSDHLVDLASHARWIESHVDELRAYPNCWVVLDAEQGIIFHSADDAEFARHIEQYGPKDRERLMIFHTSMYV